MLRGFRELDLRIWSTQPIRNERGCRRSVSPQRHYTRLLSDAQEVG